MHTTKVPNERISKRANITKPFVANEEQKRKTQLYEQYEQKNRINNLRAAVAAVGVDDDDDDVVDDDDDVCNLFL